MAQVAMTTPGALTVRMASMEVVSSCVSNSLCPLKMTPVPAMYSCFAGENSLQWEKKERKERKTSARCLQGPHEASL